MNSSGATLLILIYPSATKFNKLARFIELLAKTDCQLDLVVLNAGSCEYIDDAKAFDDVLFRARRPYQFNCDGILSRRILPLMPRGSRIGLMSSSAIYLPFLALKPARRLKAGVQYLASSLSL